jgi:uncharacterized protein (TIGR02453 family)
VGGLRREPLEHLLAGLPERYQPLKTFRPSRDVRFSNDKSPYKTQAGAVHTSEHGAVHYIQVDATGLMAAAGMYQPARDQLERLRRAIDEPVSGARLQRIVDDLIDDGLSPGPGQEPLRTAPRGYPRDHDRIELLRWKGCITSARLDGDDMVGPGARVWVLGVFERSQPLVEWLERHVGASTEPFERIGGGRDRGA